MFEILPGILEKEWNEIEKKLELIKSFAHAVHIDILDGKFANNTTFLDPKPFAKYTNDMLFEVHLMVENPEQYLRSFADAGFRRFLGHVEKMPDQESFVAKGEELGEVGLVIDGKTPLAAIKIPFIDLDCVQIMTIDAGFSGQAYNNEYAKKMHKLRDKEELLPISVDGGINEKTLVEAKTLGATRFVVNSALFGASDVKKRFHELQALLQNA